MDHPHLLFRQPNELSEGPQWDDQTNTLYWVDALEGRVWRSRHEGSLPTVTENWTAPEFCTPSTRVSSLALGGSGAQGTLVAALEEGVGTFAWDQPATLLAPLPFDGTKVCFNDGKAGPDGAFWVGAKDRAHQNGLGPLVRVWADGTTQTLAEGLTISNGLDWTPDGRWFYLADSVPRVIWKYRWDEASGRITDRVLFADGTEAPGVPDGLCVDAEGCVWSARWGGSQLVRLSPDGEVLNRVAFPVSRVSSCTFGGPHLDTLFVTTAKEDLNDAERRTEVLSGSIFALSVSVPGQKAHRFTPRSSR
jgi:L-arabinonolactonase